MKKGIVLVTYTVNKVHTYTDYFADLKHFEAFRKRNRNKIEMISYKVLTVTPKM